MAQKPVRWSFAARADLLAALEYLVEESPQAASDLLRHVEAEIMVGRYRLIYRVEGEAWATTGFRC